MIREQIQQEHPLPFDLADETSRQELTDIIKRAINEDEAPHQAMWEEWDQVDDRLSGDKTPPGWTTDALAVLQASNDPRQQAKEVAKRHKYFATINRTRPNNESVLGDFIASKKKLTINAVNPTDYNRAKAIQSRIDYIQRDQMFFHKVVFPMMDNAFPRGLHWCDVEYDPFANGLKGKIKARPVSTRDVRVDYASQGMYFDSMRRLTVATRVPVDEAMTVYGRYPIFRNHPPMGDMEYLRPYMSGKEFKQGMREYATIYKYQFKQMESRFYFIQNDGTAKEIPQNVYLKAQEDPRVRERVFEGECEEQFYVALYNPSTGVFDLKHNPFAMWMTIPLVNFYDERRTYHLGDVMVYANLTDLLDTVVTIFVNNAKRANKPIAQADPNMYEEFKTQIDSALEKGGAAPGITNVWDIKSINSHIVMLVPWLIQWIQDSVSKHSASMGQLPANQVATDTVRALQQRDRIAHGRKDVMLEWTLTEIARLFARIICKFDSEPDFFPLMDTAPGKANYIPINQVWTEDEYVANLAQMAGLQVPQVPTLDGIPDQYRQNAMQSYQEQTAQFEQQMWQLRQSFESQNDVKVEQVPGYVTADGAQYEASDFLNIMAQAMQERGMTQEEFIALYKPQETQVQVFVVNKLDEDINLSVIAQVDSDMTSDPEYIANRAAMLNERQAYSRVDMLKDMKVPDPEGHVQRANDENQMIQIAQQVADAAKKNPQIIDQIAALMNVAQNGQPQNA
jgi:hypothetical protein